ncbi:MAG: leucine-rich repeat domain-containing protein [Epsilonproteobacteria bacterium]|nr:leucine-rich repeat domain-containing protein [Campylobacterota bacterium]PIP10473.1 MAG: hypothetical protein COX50_05670 [Sulfurimonas sp. CG23_combo_of_CG06-09_8_20_14_all_36_33]PIS26103.1 MAG: hypothetical protein COT46_03975 [Sulfurimonas sp. CG08_land_8_20_14_0_20_36_33]PIU35990.1 MAG: hypothetical protein COT05_01165 [Sulfurimonas sp. CG07_land_8_20_14_0_80_36_56]PIV02792.1 MAG: hypothetical protein COS56_10745 [Sulfurimonas sp. CG03_land_8_20_14_0_80_36_25]PIV35743.1 MAG: hypothetic
MSDLQTFFSLLKKCDSDFVFEKDGVLHSNYYNHPTRTLNVKTLECKNLNEDEISSFNHLKHIQGDLVLNSKSIQTISVFNSLITLNNLVIQEMSQLESITGFNALQKIHNLKIDNNRRLKNIYGFNTLFIKNNYFNGSIKVTNNSELKNIFFFRALRGVNSSLHLHNNQLEMLKGLEDLQYVKASLSLASNKLTSLDGLEKLHTLKTTKEEESLYTLTLYGNPNLKDISALKNVSESSNDFIIIVDSTQNFLQKPKINDIFSQNNISVFAQDTNTVLSKASLCELSPNYQSHYLRIRPEFLLDEDWRPNLKYLDYAALRGRNRVGLQKKRIDLVRWQDKVYIYHFLKEHNIPSMPIIIYSHRKGDDFFEKLKSLYANGLQSFVVKATHLANSNGVYRIKDGKFINANTTALNHEMFGKEVDFDYLEDQINKKWSESQEDEDWSSMQVNPGVILEELIEDALEIKFSIVFGEVAGFFIREKGFPTFDAEGNHLDKQTMPLPFWWREGRELALKVASLVCADHIRIDVFYYNNRPIVNEITWNGGERSEFTSKISKLLNKGYAQRFKMLSKRVVDFEKDDYVNIILSKQEFFKFANRNQSTKNSNILECKFIIVHIDTELPLFYWINSKKYSSHYQFYKEVLNYECTLIEFERNNIIGSLTHNDSYKNDTYIIDFPPTERFSFEYIHLMWDMLTNRAPFFKKSSFINSLSEIQIEKIKEEIQLYKTTDIQFINFDVHRYAKDHD